MGAIGGDKFHRGSFRRGRASLVAFAGSDNVASRENRAVRIHHRTRSGNATVDQHLHRGTDRSAIKTGRLFGRRAECCTTDQKRKGEGEVAPIHYI